MSKLFGRDLVVDDVWLDIKNTPIFDPPFVTGIPNFKPGGIVGQIVKGRPDLPGPLANVIMNGDGTVNVITRGRTLHGDVDEELMRQTLEKWQGRL